MYCELEGSFTNCSGLFNDKSRVCSYYRSRKRSILAQRFSGRIGDEVDVSASFL